jgi:hypothetical protein
VREGKIVHQPITLAQQAQQGSEPMVMLGGVAGARHTSTRRRPG